ncbi:branched-chain amino acid transport system permease protein [Butyrivibrio sp. INlla16]|nr:branched-chain amino acid transport system permease protein [Butyrivibrio sp. INlla16]
MLSKAFLVPYLQIFVGGNMSFLIYLINGLSLGSIYAIIALGYTMVYGIAKMLNFAHGDFIMVGCYVIFTICSTFSGNTVVGLIAAVILCTLLGITTEKVAYKPLRGAASPLAVLITAIGVSYFLENLALLIFGADIKSFSSVVSWQGLSFAGGDLKIQGVTIITILSSVVILIVLQLFIHKTREGQAMLAVAEDKGAAMLMGINVNKTISLTFAIGSALAAIAGALLCSAYPSLSPYLGAMPGIKAFVAAVFGGIGSIPGAMIGGLVLGIVEILSRTYISSQLSDAIVFGILIVVLLVKPTGLLGKKIQEKV